MELEEWNLFVFGLMQDSFQVNKERYIQELNEVLVKNSLNELKEKLNEMLVEILKVEEIKKIASLEIMVRRQEREMWVLEVEMMVLKRKGREEVWS